MTTLPAFVDAELSCLFVYFHSPFGKVGKMYGEGGRPIHRRFEKREGRMEDKVKPARDMRIAIMGAGMAGILAGIRLLDSGYDDIVIYEKGDRVGGTWRENRYPGLTCDIPSHSYTYSFEPNPDWTQRYPPGPEILAYFEGVADRRGVLDRVQFNKEVTHAIYDDNGWTLDFADGSTDRADAVIAATGVLHHPRYPDISGLESFAGAMFHSARWPDDIAIEGRRVGVVGSGSTGMQIVAALAGQAGALAHFQRTPQWVMPCVNTPFTDEQRAAFRADRTLIRDLHQTPEDAERLRFFSRAVTQADSPEMAIIEQVARQNLENSVTDPVLREKLTPDYRAACKRLIMSPDYYQKVQMPGVEVVVDTIERIEPAGIRTIDGVLHELDILVLATGFQADRFVRPTTVTGRGGVDLDRVWERRASAYLALSIPDFPNFFLLNGPSAPFGNFSAIDVAEKQMDYVLQLLGLVRSGQADAVSIKASEMRRYDAELIDAVKDTIWSSGCQSWYLDKDGVPTIWPWSYDAFVERTRMPDVEAFDLRV